jgi:plastocyanin
MVTLGAALVLLPAVAGSETAPTIQAENKGGGYYGQTHAWSPTQATVSAGGVVTLSNPTTVAHGVEWRSGPETPSCSASIPTATTAPTSGANWIGTCTFSKPGTYVFYCTVHGPEMTATITGNAPSQAPGGGGPTGEGGPPAGSPTGSSTTPSAPGATGGQSASPLAGSAAAALKLASRQRGRSVQGSLEVSPAGAGARLEVQLLARRASLARAGRSVQVRVGRSVRSALRAGTVRFTVALDARAATALRRRHRLALSVKVVLVPRHGAAVTITRDVVMRS